MADGGASLRVWLGLYAAQSASGRPEVARTVRRLLQMAFPDAEVDAELDDWKAVVNALEAFYEAPLRMDPSTLPRGDPDGPACRTNAVLSRLLGLVLGALVQSEEKAVFVKDIMAMDASIQVDLMATIEKVMADGVDADLRGSSQMTESLPDSESSHMEVPPVHEPRGFGSPLGFSGKAELERARREIKLLKEESIHAARELEDTMKQLKQREEESRTLTAKVDELQQERERDVLRAERSVRALLDERIQQLQRRLEAVAIELEEKRALANSVPALRDEIDLLRPKAEKAAKLDATISKYKGKLESLAGLNDKLYSVERSNEELLSKSLALESQASKVPTLQRKLDEAKEANTSMAFRVSELEELLSRRQAEVADAKAGLETAQNSLEEALKINRQLQESVNAQLNGEFHSDSPTDTHTLGNGISELNPELMQKVRRLEHENAELRVRLNSETSEQIETLQDQVDDISRLKKSFESRYFETVHQLETSKERLKITEVREAKANEIITALRDELRDVTSLHDTYKKSLELARCNIEALQNAKNQLDREFSQKTQEALSLQVQVAERDEKIRQLNALHNLLKEQHSMLQEDFDGCATERRDALRSISTQRESISTQKEQLSSMATQMDALSYEIQSTSEQLRAQKEVSAMQLEELRSTLLDHEEKMAHLVTQEQQARAKFAQEHDTKVSKMEKKHSHALARMSCVIGEKSTIIEELKTRMAEREAECKSTLEEYKSMHSVSNAEWNLREQGLQSELEQVSRQRDMLLERETELTAHLHQKDANIVEITKASEELIVEKQARITRLKDSTERLKSRVTSLEKERHFLRQDTRQRSIESASASMLTQLSNQITSVTSELEALTREHQTLQVELQKCCCDRQTSRREGGRVLSPEEKKDYYRSRVRHLEQTAQQQDEKRRELLLVNAKLVQEQKQLQIKNAGLLAEMQQLKEKLNRSLLREERRRKEEQGSSRSAIDESPHQLPLQKGSQQNNVTQEGVEPSKRSALSAQSSPATATTNAADRNGGLSSPSGVRSGNDRKRGAEVKNSISTSGQYPPLKRRLSHFFSNNPTSSESASTGSKPSECNQQ